MLMVLRIVSTATTPITRTIVRLTATMPLAGSLTDCSLASAPGMDGAGVGALDGDGAAVGVMDVVGTTTVGVVVVVGMVEVGTAGTDADIMADAVTAADHGLAMADMATAVLGGRVMAVA